MKVPLPDIIHLLHSVDTGVLATHSLHTPGYPYATVLPFALDPQHRPIFLISALAEHTKNLLADPRASFVVHAAAEGDVLSGARITLVGDVERIDANDLLRARYLRYQPSAEQYLTLADFAFFRLTPKRLRAIAGFGAMGWIESDDFNRAATISLEQEHQQLPSFEGIARKGELLGVDAYGVDLRRENKRERIRNPKVGEPGSASGDA